MDSRPRAVASFDDQGVSSRKPNGLVESVRWDELRLVEVRTTDEGPFVADVYLVLHAGKGGCVVSQEDEGFGPLFERLQQLPGFDNEAFISAMSCTDNAIFECWRRTEAASTPGPG
ncbi:hypothetical protein [Singulisphaera sp. PoT]|uniref:hypothetical protein n=1 Tax=Singulisphaera sp. PoT TaxID=3411797 RepID=UPI003BF60AA8